MDSISFSATKIKPKAFHKSKTKMTSKMLQDEINRIYYMRSVAKSNARIDGRKKRMLVKLRHFKNEFMQYCSQIFKESEFEISLWPFKNF